MLRKTHENGRSQPTNQSISQYKDTAETELNCTTLLSISAKINLFQGGKKVSGCSGGPTG